MLNQNEEINKKTNKPYVNFYNNLYQNGLQQHNQINNQNNFSINSINEKQNQFMESQFNDPEILQYQQHNPQQKPIQTTMQQSYYQPQKIDIPETQETIFMKKSNVQQNDTSNKNNFFYRNNLQSNMYKQNLVNDNRIVMSEVDKYKKYYKQEKDNKTKLNERLYEVGPLSMGNRQFFNPSIQNRDPGFFDFNKPENTRLTFNPNKQKQTNEKITSYQELTKEFHKPIKQIYQSFQSNKK